MMKLKTWWTFGEEFEPNENWSVYHSRKESTISEMIYSAIDRESISEELS